VLEVIQIPALTDNYIYFLCDTDSSETAIIDPSEAGPVLSFLKTRPQKLTYILNTHHHWDHTGGNLEIKNSTGCQIVGYSIDAHRIPGIDIELKDEDIFRLGSSEARVLFIPGHTVGHIAYYFKDAGSLFCGDTLFSLGCGKLFEGTPAQMFASLNRLKELPDETLVYCGHEYTLANAAFAKTVDPKNSALQKRSDQVKKLRDSQRSTVPSRMGEEKLCNPFLKAKTESRFAELRKLKDLFSE
jgi:hydroxyacylglutathione hydrolase